MLNNTYGLGGHKLKINNNRFKITLETHADKA